MTALHDLGGALGRPLDTFFWALTLSWSRLLACVQSDLEYHARWDGARHKKKLDEKML